MQLRRRKTSAAFACCGFGIIATRAREISLWLRWHVHYYCVVVQRVPGFCQGGSLPSVRYCLYLGALTNAEYGILQIPCSEDTRDQGTDIPTDRSPRSILGCAILSKPKYVYFAKMNASLSFCFCGTDFCV
jgi:hypothetical protein